MKNQPSPFLSIEESKSAQIVQMSILLVWFIFCVYKFNVNPIFFGISIGVTPLLFYKASFRQVILLKEDKIDHLKKSIFNINKMINTIPYSDVSSCEYHRTQLNLLVILLMLLGLIRFFSFSREHYLIIELLNGKSVEIRFQRSKRETLEMCHQIQKRINPKKSAQIK